MKKKLFFIALASILLNSCIGTTTNNNSSENKKELKAIPIGEVLHTDYFDVTVNKFEFMSNIKTGNRYTNVKAEDGSIYAVINVSFKNIDTESRMLFDGSLLINQNGKVYTFDKSETILVDGWGIMLDQINPMITKTTNIVYKIPADITGLFFYSPERSDETDIIYLGEVKAE